MRIAKITRHVYIACMCNPAGWCQFNLFWASISIGENAHWCILFLTNNDVLGNALRLIDW